MDNQPLVTIITPSFNQAKYLSAAYHSVVTQSYPDIEYFIVDGGSTDGSVDLIRNWAEQKNSCLKWWVSEKDKGQADAINKGFSKATGKIIAWLNSDDLYMRGAIEKAVEIFNANPDIGLIFSDVFSIDAESKLINVMRYGDWDLLDLMEFNIIGQPGVFIRKQALEKTGFLDPAYHYLLDHHLWLRIASNYKIQHVNDFFAAARFHSEAKNIAQTEGFSKDAFSVIEWMKTDPKLSKIFEKNRRKISAGAFRFSARYLMDGGDNAGAFSHYLKGLWHYPPAVLKDFPRVAYSALSFLPVVKRKKADYLQKRLNRLSLEKMDKIYDDLSGQNGIQMNTRQFTNESK
jgi:glycosyltransferase involved in cell wall biosynthesis